VVEGINHYGARILKVTFPVTPGGTITHSPLITPNNTFTEMWRAEYNSCTKYLVVAGGGHGNEQAAIIDLNQSTPTFKASNVLNANSIYHDVSLLTVDNDSICYMATSRAGGGGPTNTPLFNNILVKSKINKSVNNNPAFLGTSSLLGANEVPTRFRFHEIKSTQYIKLGSVSYEASNAMNGMAVSTSSLYGYNSDTLKIWDKNNFSNVYKIKVQDGNDGVKDVNGNNLDFYSSGFASVKWGGLAVTSCNDVFVGLAKKVVQYKFDVATGSITKTNNVYSFNDTVYDVKLNKNNDKLYVCGKGFVSVIDISANSITAPVLSISKTDANCGLSNGTATASLSCIPGVAGSLNYQWSTTPVQNTATATGLTGGNTYTVTASSCGKTLTQVVTINNTGSICNLVAIDFDFNPYMSKYNYVVGGGGTVEVDKTISFTNTSSAACNGGTYAWEIREWGTTNNPIHTSTSANTSFKFLQAHVGKCYRVTFSITINGCITTDYKKICIGEVIPPCENCIGSFAPEPGKDYVLSAWVKEGSATPTTLKYNNAKIIIYFPTSPSAPTSGTSIACSPSGIIIDGWQRIDTVFTIPAGSTYINLQLNSAIGDSYFDDIRVFPKDGSMTSYVYDPTNLRLVAELDERNYATMYEYDEEGKLVRVKKETEKGIMTIKENKNNTKKKQ